MAAVGLPPVKLSIFFFYSYSLLSYFQTVFPDIINFALCVTVSYMQNYFLDNWIVMQDTQRYEYMKHTLLNMDWC